ncbi:site-specific integrase [Massilia antarctica]|uniref:site-specific integrase n=1 Tax=Massilia antarctica TaxID=2765360 RepID=UPI00226FE53A|nr:site-specific integrase [Massilia sp. H27-R4]MCY0913218.1 DUF3596 domain-containing protein [Massilia sp. H27-R4]
MTARNTGRAAGVEIRENSVRLYFWLDGKQRKETLYLDNAPLPPTPANVKYARRVAADVRKRLAAGTFSYAEFFPHSPRAKEAAPGGPPLLFDVMDSYLLVHNVKSSTKHQYRTRLDNFWKVHLKNVRVDLVSYSDIMAALGAGTWKSNKSRNNELSLIKGVFEYAVRDKLIQSNPCENVERAKYQKPPPDPFDMSEVNLILDELRAHRPEQLLNFVQTMFFTGLRTSEGIALKWENIDFRKKEMKIEGANVYDEEVDTTKTFEARVVKLTHMALEALDRQKSHTLLHRGHVFHDPKTGQAWGYAKITDTRSFWGATLTKIGIRHRRPYNMRHTYATIGLMSGAKPGFLAKQLGHSLEMFFNVYAKWISSDDDDRELDKMNGMIARTIPNLSPAKKMGG